MLTRLKPHLNASTAIAFLALCLAISGGAFAATNHASNKTNSLTATTAKSSKGKTGARGPAGPAGPKGASGATGATGATGPVGAIGPAGPAGPAGTNASEVGPAGPAGASVLISALGRREHGCEEGGTLFKVGGTESTACNGESIAGTSVTSKEIKLGETTCNKVGGAEYTAYEDNKTTICNGTDGTNGTSVTSNTFTAGDEPQSPVKEPCKAHGGAEFKSASPTPTFACNGEEGSGGGGGYTEILPEGKTETGTWGASFSAEGLVSSMISFPIRLGKALAPTAVHYVPVCTSLTGERQAECETVRSSSIASCSGSAEAPTAAEGSLCLYQGGTEEPEGTLALDVPRITLPGSSYNGTAGAGTAGAVAFIHYEGPPAEADSAKLLGSWAVTAPAP